MLDNSRIMIMETNTDKHNLDNKENLDTDSILEKFNGVWGCRKDEYNNLNKAKNSKDKSKIIEAIMALKQRKDKKGNPCDNKFSVYSRNLTPLLNNINKLPDISSA